MKREGRLPPAANNPDGEATGSERQVNCPDRDADSLNCAPHSLPCEQNGSAGAGDGSEAQTNGPERFADSF